MIENSYVTIESDGKRVSVNCYEDGELREGPATFPARYASFAAIIQYANTQFNSHYLGINENAQIQEFLGSPWPSGKLRFNWKDLQSLPARVSAPQS
jgi:hypothetical protein